MSATRSPKRQSTPASRSVSGNQVAMTSPSSIVSPTIVLLPSHTEGLLDLLDNWNFQEQSVRNPSSTETINEVRKLKPFDPIAFLNQHYDSEAVLVQQLPALRESVSRRMEVLNDRIATALQRQADSASSMRRHVQDAKSSCNALEHRILQVREKAAASERAVLEITADMKRLDCAKRHLNRTITTLKRLHMLVQAAEQLRLTSIVTQQNGKDITMLHSFPDYKTAANLVEAIKQLEEYFQPYIGKVQQMQLLCRKVQEYQDSLRMSLVFGFRVVAFGRWKALKLSASNTKGSTGENPEMKVENTEDESEDRAISPKMSQNDMIGSVMFIDALGQNTRKEFIHNFCQDVLGDYLKEFEPASRKSATKQEVEKRVSSFKKVEQKPAEAPSKSQASLDLIENRFTWFLNGPMRTIKTNFPNVFPSRWNLEACLVGMFLQLVRRITCRLQKTTRELSDNVTLFSFHHRRETMCWHCWMDHVETPTPQMPRFF